MKRRSRIIVIEIPKPRAKELNRLLRSFKGGKMVQSHRRKERTLRKLEDDSQ
jgi:hypothetical protein